MTLRLATARDICQWLYGDPDGVPPLRPGTIRTWKSRGQLRAYGRQGRWNLYDVDAVLALVDARDTRKRATTHGSGSLL